MAAKQDYLCQERPQLHIFKINFKISFFTLKSNLNSTVNIILIRKFKLDIELFCISNSHELSSEANKKYDFCMEKLLKLNPTCDNLKMELLLRT